MFDVFKEIPLFALLQIDTPRLLNPSILGYTRPIPEHTERRTARAIRTQDGPDRHKRRQSRSPSPAGNAAGKSCPVGGRAEFSRA